MAVSYSAVRHEVETFSGEKASLLGELSIGGQHLFSTNNTSRRGSQLRAEGSYQQRSCAIEDCYQALLRYRSSRTDNNGTESHLTEKGGGHAAAALKARFGENDQEVGEKQRPDHGPDLSGQRIAYLFAIKAKQTLHTTEFEKLQDFLNTPPETYDLEDLHRKVLEKLRIFYAAELLESGEPSNKLAAPSGPENAEFGLIMHCQSKEGGIGEFWDIESRSIQTLAEKGLSKDFVFGFDWHWRGETSARGRGPCPATQWTRTLQDLHNAFSCSVLEILPLRLLVIAGSCPKKQYRKNLSNRAKTIELVLTPNLLIQFDLDFMSNGLRRITAYMDHPSASFFRPNSSVQRSFCQEATLNFFLWLTGKKYSLSTFTTIQRAHQRGVPGSAPLKEVWRYVQIEKDINRRLEEQEYEQGFFTWARGFLKEDPAEILRRGHSIVGTIRDEMRSRIQVTNSGPEQLARRANLNRQLNESRYGYSVREYWHGETVRITKNGDLRIFVSTSRPALLLRLGKKNHVKIQGYGSPAVIIFSKTAIVLKVGESIVYEKSRKKLLGLKHGLKWVEQIDREVINLEQQRSKANS